MKSAGPRFEKVLERNLTELRLEEIHPPSMSISESTLAVAFHDSTGQTVHPGKLCVWNWREGNLIQVSFFISYFPPWLSIIHTSVRTWLVAGRKESSGRKATYLLCVMDTRSGFGTTFQLSTSSATNECHSFRLNSGESALYSSSPESGPPRPSSSEAIVAVLLQSRNVESGMTITYCAAMPINRLLEKSQSSELFIDNRHDWEGHIHTSLEEYILQGSPSLSVSGRRILWPLKKTDKGKFEVVVCEFNPGPIGRRPTFQEKWYTIEGAKDVNESKVMMVKDTLIHLEVWGSLHWF